jgi:ribosome biogenesis GTPase
LPIEKKENIEGTVRKSTGSWYIVRDDQGKDYNCRMQGKFRLDGLKSTNPIAVGDRVRFTIDDNSEGSIGKILPRNNYVIRQSPRKKHNVHLIASNIDQAMLIITITRPDIKFGFIDRFLLMTEPYDIPVIIVINKQDLLTKEDEEFSKAVSIIYESIGYEVMLVSALSGQGINELKLKLKDKITLLSGQSGVGKTSLINAIEPQQDLRTFEISDYSGKGQHTTTFAEMLTLSFGGEIIDTPGIKTLGFNHFEILDVAHNFKEIFKKSSECKFSNCTHINEPHCAVKQSVEEGSIHPVRYTNYVQLVEEVKDSNYWERHKDI